MERQITGHIEHPRVQQQHKHPQNSHLTLIGKFFLKVTLTLVTVALNSSGATRACSPEGNSVSNRLDKPNLRGKKYFYEYLIFVPFLQKNLYNYLYFLKI